MIKRRLEKTIKELLKLFPAVALIGARQVGKSTLMKTVLPEAKFFDLEKEKDFNYINNEPLLFLDDTTKPIAIDEAQLCPQLFPALRVAIDKERNKKGQFLISGSSSQDLQNNITESLAGRIAIIEIPCLTWDEALGRQQSLFYSKLDRVEEFFKLKALYSREEIYDLCLHGLFPEPFINKSNKIFYQQWQENYFKAYIERDIRALFPQLQIESYRKLIRMLATTSGEVLKISNFARSLDISEPTVKRYLDIAEGTFVWSRIKPYSKNIKKRLVKTAKAYIKDNNLINYMLNINDIDTLQTHPQYGLIWQSFVIEQIKKNLNSNLQRHYLYFYRTHNGSEIDLVLETESQLIPIEIKAGQVVKKHQIKALENFIEEHNCSYGLVINNADEVLRLSPKIYQVPAIFL